jgi:hypothetical protein
MVLENAQMIHAVLHRYGVTNNDYPNLYRLSHSNHPCTRWAGNTRSNFNYVVDLSEHMERERLRRGFNPHSSIIKIREASKFSHLIPEGDLTSHPNCTSDFKHIADVHEAYRKQLAKKWYEDVNKPVWNRRDPPLIYGGWHGDFKEMA